MKLYTLYSVYTGAPEIGKMIPGHQNVFLFFFFPFYNLAGDEKFSFEKDRKTSGFSLGV